METGQGQRIYVVLENVRSAQNVGAIFRTADAIGVTTIFLVGYTPLPVDRFGRAQPDIAKTALGAEQVVPWEHVATSDDLLARLNKTSASIVVVEQDARAVDYKSCDLQGDAVLVFGNEVDGVSRLLCDAADTIVAVPMRGQKESLNVSVTAGIVLFRLFDH